MSKPSKRATEPVDKFELNQRIHQALLSRYPVREFVNVFECPSSNAGGRRCDLISFGVWKSTGNKVIGHEIKVDRGDWLRELQQPDKADAFATYVDAWYLVAPPGVVRLEELRPAWGLLELSRSDSLRVRRQPTPSDSPRPMDRNMLAAILRKVTAKVDEEQIQARIRQALEAARKQFESTAGYREKSLVKQCETLKARIESFEKHTGLHIDRYSEYGDQSLGKAVKLVRNRTPEELVSQYRVLAEAFDRVTKSLNGVLDDLQNPEEPEPES